MLFRNIMKLWCCMFSSWLKIVFNLISGLTSGFTFRWCFLNGNTLYYKTFITVYFGRQFCGLFQKESKTIPCTLETEHHLLIRNSSSLGRVMNHFQITSRHHTWPHWDHTWPPAPYLVTNHGRVCSKYKKRYSIIIITRIAKPI